MITTPTDFVDVMGKQSILHKDEVISDLHERAYGLEMQVAHELFQAGDFHAAKHRVRNILSATDIPVHLRVSAVLQLENIEWSELIQSEEPQIKAAVRKAVTGQELWDITKNGPKYLKLFALIAKTAGDLGLLIHQRHGLSMSLKVQQTTPGDELALLIVNLQLNGNLIAIGKKYRHCLRLARIAAKSPYRWALSRAIVRIAAEVPALAAVLESVGHKELAEQYRTSGFQLVRLAATIANESENMDELWDAIVAAIILEPNGPDGEMLRWARSMMELLPTEYRERVEVFYSRTIRRWAGEILDGDIRTNPKQIHQNILSGFGINPSEPFWDALVDLAVRDANPSRVLKDCTHLFVTLGSRPQSFSFLGLKHAGSKIIHCTLHRYARQGPALDRIYDEFKRKYCDACKDKSERDPNWRYSSKWQEQEHMRHVGLAVYLEDDEPNS
jgi:hypothetical protein